MLLYYVVVFEGRGAKEANLYTEVAEGIHCYGITKHRHGTDFHMYYIMFSIYDFNFIITITFLILCSSLAI